MWTKRGREKNWKEDRKKNSNAGKRLSVWARTYSDHIRSIVGKKPDNLRDLFTLSSIYMPFVHFVLFADFVVAGVVGFDFGVVGFKHSTHTHTQSRDSTVQRRPKKLLFFQIPYRFHIGILRRFAFSRSRSVSVSSMHFWNEENNNERRNKIACETETHIENSLCSGFKMWPLVCAFFSVHLFLHFCLFTVSISVNFYFIQW